ncbi:tetratricopeptide repeat protein, partial [bacterium]|nr:tetratricopeptide repeat protein [bacterium]
AELPDDVELANCLIAFANVRARLGDYDGLGALYERALTIATATTGPRSALAAKVLTNHAIFKKITGDYAAARELHERTLGIQIGLHGEQHPDVARTYYNLGNLLVETGEYGVALDHYRTSLAIREKTLGPDSADTARSLTALALAEKHLADFLPALEHAERAVTILRGQSLERHPQSADALTALASIQSDLGDLDAARASLEQALTIYERAYGPDHLRVGQVIGELGMLGQLAGDLPASLASYRRARGIYEAIDPDHDRVAGILNVEAALLAEMGQLREARDLAARSVANRERALSPDHPALGWSLATLGRCLWLGGETARAQTVLLRALAILGPSRGEVHPIYLAARYDLACVRRLRGATDVALDLALTVERGRRESVRATMSGLPERLALIYASRWPNGLDLAVDIATTGAAATPAITAVWEDLLKSRALVLDEMALRQRTVAASGATVADSLQQALAAATRELAGALVRSWRSDGSTGKYSSPGKPVRRGLSGSRALTARRPPRSMTVRRTRPTVTTSGFPSRSETSGASAGGPPLTATGAPGSFDKADGLVVVSGLVGEQPQTVQAFRVIGAVAQQALVKKRGLDRIAPLVEVRSPGQQAAISGGRSCEREAARQGVDAPGRPGHGGRPVGGRFLAHETHGRVPGAVRAVEQPAPVRHVGQEQVDGFAHGAGQVGDRRVDGHHQVQVGDGRSRIGEVPELAAEVVDRHPRRRSFALQQVCGGTLLESEQPHARNGRPRGEPGQRRRAARVGGRSGPDQTNPQPVSPNARCPG